MTAARIHLSGSSNNNNNSTTVPCAFRANCSTAALFPCLRYGKQHSPRQQQFPDMSLSLFLFFFFFFSYVFTSQNSKFIVADA